MKAGFHPKSEIDILDVIDTSGGIRSGRLKKTEDLPWNKYYDAGDIASGMAYWKDVLIKPIGCYNRD